MRLRPVTRRARPDTENPKTCRGAAAESCVKVSLIFADVSYYTPQNHSTRNAQFSTPTLCYPQFRGLRCDHRVLLAEPPALRCSVWHRSGFFADFQFSHFQFFRIARHGHVKTQVLTTSHIQIESKYEEANQQLSSPESSRYQKLAEDCSWSPKISRVEKSRRAAGRANNPARGNRRRGNGSRWATTNSGLEECCKTHRV